MAKSEEAIGELNGWKRGLVRSTNTEEWVGEVSKIGGGGRRSWLEKASKSKVGV